MIILAGQVEGGEALVTGNGVNGCTVSQEKFHHLPVALESSHVERSQPLRATGVHQEGTTRGKLEKKVKEVEQ